MLLECISLKSMPKVALKGMLGKIPSRLNPGRALLNGFFIEKSFSEIN
jgi:hypothetical protein